MRIAVPLVGGRFCEHFGRCDQFLICDVREPAGPLDRRRIVERPRPKCESLPNWLAELGVCLVLVGGIGPVGRRNLEERGIAVSVGHAGHDPDQILANYLSGTIGASANPCVSFEHHHHHCRRQSI